MSADKKTAIFVTGLPEDSNFKEIYDYFAKYGVIMDNMFTGEPRIKMYYKQDGEEEECFRGEALIVYLREESARMAVMLLDDSYFRPNIKISVDYARWEKEEEEAKEQSASQMPDGSNRKVDRKKWKTAMQQMHKKLEWTTDDKQSVLDLEAMEAERKRAQKWKRILVLEGMYSELTPNISLDLKEDLIEECEKYGQISSVNVLGSGRCMVKFKDWQACEACRRVMDGRYFDGKRIQAHLYDGSHSLKDVKFGADGEEDEIIDKFGDWLEAGEEEGK